jgi:hypothetical protein
VNKEQLDNVVNKVSKENRVLQAILVKRVNRVLKVL